MKLFKSAAGFLVLAILAAGCAGSGTPDTPSQSGETSATQPPSGTASTRPVAAPGTQTAAVQNVRVQFAPVIGASAEAVPPLSTRLSSRAGQHGLTVSPQAEGATHVVKGYFSTISENGRTTVIYVWDVLDPAGNRLHRIQGQQQASGGSGEGWPAVTGATMETIADRTVDELVGWLATVRS